MASKDAIELTGKVVELLPDARFRIELENGQRILARLSGGLRLHFVRVVPGDRVTLERSPYDLGTGRITRRHEPTNPTTQKHTRT
jgi:translation initiation factor IF-1